MSPIVPPATGAAPAQHQRGRAVRAEPSPFRLRPGSVGAMSTDPWAALERLTTSLNRHLTAVEQRRGMDDPQVGQTYDQVADAYQEYEDAHWDAHGESLPLDLYDEDDDASDEDQD